jgi:hypothetical protein
VEGVSNLVNQAAFVVVTVYKTKKKKFKMITVEE